MQKVNSIEDYIAINSHFAEALNMLRQIITSTELEETLKWNSPVYELKGKKVLGLGAFKNHFSIWFYNGVFLKDKDNILVSASEKTKALRQLRFKGIDDIDKSKVLEYIKEAIENQKLGKELLPERQDKLIVIPTVLKDALKIDSSFEKSFHLLTHGKQREYAEYVAIAKREATKISRLTKIKPMILKGVGLNDAYKNC